MPELYVWLMSSTLGLLLGLFNWLDAREDRRIRQQAGPSPLDDWIAWHAVARGALLLAAFGAKVVAGFNALGGGPREITVWLLILGNALVTTSILLERRERLRLQSGNWPTPGNGLGQSGEPGID